MNGRDTDDTEIRKVAVVFDPVVAGLSLLDVAAELTASLGAELEAVLVCDPDIDRLSRLPFGRMIEIGSGKAVAFDEAALQSGRAGPEARSRATLRRLSRQHRFSYSVRHLANRGALEADSEIAAELLVVAASHGKFGGAAQTDLDAFSIATRSPLSVLLVGGSPAINARIVVVGDDSPVGLRASQIAARLHQGHHARTVNRVDPDRHSAGVLADLVRAGTPSLVVVGFSDAGTAAGLTEELKQDPVSVLLLK